MIAEAMATGPAGRVDSFFQPFQSAAVTYHKEGWNMENDNTAQIDALLEEQDKKQRSDQAAIVNAKLDELDSHVTMLRAMGVDVSITLDAPTSRPLDKIEKVGSTKEIGWYCYVDFLDEEGTKRRIDAAKAAAAYAANGGQ